MGNEVPSGKPAQGVPEKFEITMEHDVEIEDESESESSPSGGYRFVMWQMRVKA